jgi:hypothetical protein
VFTSKGGGYDDRGMYRQFIDQVAEDAALVREFGGTGER